MEALKQGSDAFFILIGGIMVLAMHAVFAFLERGTVRKKNQANALIKILVDFFQFLPCCISPRVTASPIRRLFLSAPNRYRKDRTVSAHPPSNIPFLALGAWILTVGRFGFNVMSAQPLDKLSGLVTVCAGSDLMHRLGAMLAGRVACV
jgi:ammonia channel protein AmtB